MRALSHQQIPLCIIRKRLWRSRVAVQAAAVHLLLFLCRFYIIGELLAAFIVAGFATTYWGVGELRRPVSRNAAHFT